MSEPAFPTVDEHLHFGMTLRDYFAGQALQGTLAHVCNSLKDPQPVKDYARKAYEIADAMLTERAGGGQ